MAGVVVALLCLVLTVLCLQQSRAWQRKASVATRARSRRATAALEHELLAGPFMHDRADCTHGDCRPAPPQGAEAGTPAAGQDQWPAASDVTHPTPGGNAYAADVLRLSREGAH